MQHADERGKKVLALIPLNIDGYLFQWDSGKASVLKERLAGDFTGWQGRRMKDYSPIYRS